MDGKEPSSTLGSRAGAPGDPFAPADIAARSSGLRRLRAWAGWKLTHLRDLRHLPTPAAIGSTH